MHEPLRQQNLSARLEGPASKVNGLDDLAADGPRRRIQAHGLEDDIAGEGVAGEGVAGEGVAGEGLPIGQPALCLPDPCLPALPVLPVLPTLPTLPAELGAEGGVEPDLAEREGQREGGGLMARQEQRHEFISQLLAREAVTRVVARGPEVVEQTGLLRVIGADDGRVDDLPELISDLTHARSVPEHPVHREEGAEPTPPREQPGELHDELTDALRSLGGAGTEERLHDDVEGEEAISWCGSTA